MRTKEISKKLSLNKKTIVHLNNDEMNAVQGRFAKQPACSLYCPSTSESPDCSYQPGELT